MSKKIYVVGGSSQDFNWLQPLGFERGTDLNDSQFVMFCGGNDLAASEYGEEKGSWTGRPNFERDEFEKKVFNEAVRKGVSIISTCLGSQRCNVLSFPQKAKLIQHMSHPHYHKIRTPFAGFDNFEVISTHHQMALLDENVTGLKEGTDYLLLGWAEKLSKNHYNGKDVDYKFPENFKEVEITYIPHTRSLNFQTHLEWMDLKSEAVKYGQFLVQKYLL